MSVFCVRWTIIPSRPSQPWLTCARCGTARPFRSSGRFRLNASGRLLDAWLIYRCTACDGTWNRPVLERTRVRDVDPPLRAALTANDPDLARRTAFDLADLRQRAARIEIFPEAQLQKQATGGSAAAATAVLIAIAAEGPVGPRTDRLLATGLALSRRRVADLHTAGALAVASARARPLRRTAADGMAIRVDLAGLPDGPAIAAAAGDNAGDWAAAGNRGRAFGDSSPGGTRS